MKEKNQFKLFDVNNPDDWKSLIALCNIKDKKGVLLHILSYLKEFVGLHTILAEDQYIDADYRNEFSYLYSKTFKNYSSYCIRLHFFQKAISDIEEIEKPGSVTNSLGYLGYTVVRPVDVGKVGRTIITYQNNKFDPELDYVLCTASFNSHIFGKEFEIKGSPFIKQESMVMTCAQASIWMAARYMHKKYGFKCHLPHDITEGASISLGWAGRTLPSEGLTVYMMLNALKNMGYSPVFALKPLLHDYENTEKYNKALEDWNPISYIYKYVESQIPVILMMPEHAITVIGHTFTPNLQSQKINDLIKKFISEKKHAIISSYHWVDGFIIHDDRSGPYKILPVNDELKGNLIDRGLASCFPKDDIYKTGKDIEGVIVPLPDKIYLLGDNIDGIAEKLISDEILSLKKIKIASGKGCQVATEFLDALLPEAGNPIVTRSYFTLSEQYKAKINAQPPETGLHIQIRKKYSEMRMPRFIWIIELTTMQRLSQKSEQDRTILGEIILDTTSNKYHSMPFLSLHYPGVFIEQEIDKGELKPEFYVPDDRAYRHISRQKP